MNTLCLAVVIAATGIDTGWQPLSDGQFEYILQLEPQAIEALRAGQEVASDVPAKLAGIRHYRVTAGTETLPRQGTLPMVAPASSAAATDVTALKVPPEQFGWQTLEGGGFECILQLDAKRLDALAAGEGLRGELPVFLQDVRTYRITLGSQPLPRAPINTNEAQTPAPVSPPLRDSLIQQASAEMPPALTPTTVEKTSNATTDSSKSGTPSTAGYAPTDTGSAQSTPDEAGSPSSVSPPLAAIIPTQLKWSEPYTFVLITLFTSVGMNLYLGWVTWNANGRYRRLRQQVVGERESV